MNKKKIILDEEFINKRMPYESGLEFSKRMRNKSKYLYNKPRLQQSGLTAKDEKHIMELVESKIQQREVALGIDISHQFENFKKFLKEDNERIGLAPAPSIGHHSHSQKIP